MGHFICHVLSKSDQRFVDSDFCQKLVRSAHEVSEGFVIDDLFLNCLADSHILEGSLFSLVLSGKEWQFEVSVVFEFFMGFVCGVDEILDFGHLEFSAADKLVARSDFVPETQPNLCCSERKFVAVLFQESWEVEEDALCRLWSKEGGYFG